VSRIALGGTKVIAVGFQPVTLEYAYLELVGDSALVGSIRAKKWAGFGTPSGLGGQHLARILISYSLDPSALPSVAEKA
jgi:hypothetical protein